MQRTYAGALIVLIVLHLIGVVVPLFGLQWLATVGVFLWFLYDSSPSNILFGTHVRWWDAAAIVTFMLLSTRILLAGLARARLAMQDQLFSFVSFVPADVQGFTIPVTDEVLQTWLSGGTLHSSQLLGALSENLTLGVSSMPVTVQGISSSAGGLLEASGFGGSLLQLINSVLQRGVLFETVGLVLGFVGFAVLVLASLRFPQGGVSKLFGKGAWFARATKHKMIILSYVIVFFGVLLSWIITMSSSLLLVILFLGLVVLWKPPHITFGSLFTSWKTLPLGVAALLLLRFLVDLSTFSFNNWASGLSLLVQILSLLGMITLITAPFYAWYKAYRIRTRPQDEPEHVHHPRLSEWVIGAALASVTAFIIAPSFELSGAGGAVTLVGKDISLQNPLMALLWIAIAFVVFLVAGAWRRFRNMSMALLFGIGVAFLGYYTFLLFENMLLYGINTAWLLLTSGGLGILPGVWLFVVLLVNLFFSVAGFLSYAYELARE